MSKGAVKEKAKALKKEKENKKANQKKIIILCVCAAVTLVVSAAIIFAPGLFEHADHSHNDAEIYSHGRSSIELNADRTFSASLPHGVRKNGTYTKTSEGSRTMVNFNVNGNIEVGRIENNSLYLPREWDDGHGHGNVFPRAGSAQVLEHNHSQGDGHDH